MLDLIIVGLVIALAGWATDCAGACEAETSWRRRGARFWRR